MQTSALRVTRRQKTVLIIESKKESRQTFKTEENSGQKTQGFKGNLVVLAGSGAINSLGGGITSAYVSLYFISLGGNPITLGLMTSAAAIIQCVVLFLGGVVADHYGRKRIMVITAFYGVLFPLLYASVQDWHVFVIVAIMAAFGAISSPASHAAVADSTPVEKRTTWIATLQIVSSFPMMFAPLLGGLIINVYGLNLGFRLACMLTAVFTALSALTLLFLRETMQKKGNKNVDSAPAKLKNLKTDVPKSLISLLIAYGLVAFANGTVSQFYVLYATKVIGLQALDWGIILSLQVVLATLLKIPGAWASDRFGKKKVMAASVLACAPCTIIFALSRSFVQAAVAALLLIAAGIYYAPAHEALQADLTPKEVRGRITAFWDIDIAIATALGALTGGFFYQVLNPAMPFYACTAMELAAAVVIIAAVKEPQRARDG